VATLKPPRVVLDTNVALSALVFGGETPRALRDAWHSGRCEPLLSSATAAELIRVLAYPKFKLTAAEQENLLADYLPFCTIVRMPAKLPKTPACRDPFDRPFLELALAGKAQYLIAGDGDLHSLAGGFGCPIVTVATFFESLHPIGERK